MAYLTGSSLESIEIVNALGLPKGTRWFELRIGRNEVATVTACIQVKDEVTGGLSDVLKRFRLEQQPDPEDGADKHTIDRKCD